MLQPPRPESIRDVAYVVQPGDDVAHIAQKVTGQWQRWPELVGANMHKGTVGAPNVPYRVFSSLQPGEKLYVPSSWPGPGNVGQAIPEMAVIQQTVGSAWDTIVASMQTQNVPMPAQMPSANQAAHIIYSWWPYVQNEWQSQNPQTTPPPLDPTNAAYWRMLILSLVPQVLNFLRATGATPARVPAIPWDQIPAQFPWASVEELSTRVGISPGALWTFLVKSFEQKPVGAAQMMAASKYAVPGYVTGPSGRLGEVPDFVAPGITDFATPPWNQIPYDVLARVPPDFMAKLGDPAVQACLRDVTPTKVARLKKMIDCKQCYEGKGAQEFVNGICGSADPCACTLPPPPIPGGPPPPPEPPIDESAVEGEKEVAEEDNKVLYVLGIGAVAAIAGYYLLK